MNRNQLALEVGRQFGDGEALVGAGTLDLVAIGLTLGRLVEIEQARIQLGIWMPL